MSNHDHLLKRAQRYSGPPQSIEAYMAERLDILMAAKAAIEELELDDCGAFDVVAVARFLAGEPNE